MAESVNGGSKTPAQPPKEMSMEVRLLIAFLLMGAVMFLTPYFFKSQAPPPVKKDAAGQTASQSPSAVPTAPDGKPTAEATAGYPPGPAPAAEAAEAAAETVPLPVGATPQKAEPAFVIETDLYKIAFSNQGGTVRSWQLKKTKGNDLKTLDLVDDRAGIDPTSSLYLPSQTPFGDVRLTWYEVPVELDGLAVTYQ